MALAKKFTAFIKKENLFRQEDNLLVAVSGGVDSVVLCDLCASAGFHFSIAHCNFQLRGNDSNEDEIFVKQLALHYGVNFFSKKFDTEAYAAQHKLTIQVAARNLRYNWFEEILASHKEQPAIRIKYLLTAHHADDNIETMLMNFFKGSGINGLKSILPKQKHIIRPVLFAFKKDILDYAFENKLAFREDASNASDKYTRNYFRNQLIPGIEKVFPDVKHNLADNAERFREIQQLYSIAFEKIKKKMLLFKGNELRIPVLRMLSAPALHSVVFEIIKDYGFHARQVEEVIKLLQSESGKYIVSATHRILKNRKWIIISPLQAMENNYVLLEAGMDSIIFPGGKISLEEKEQPVKISSEPNVCFIDFDKIKFPLLLRKYKTGDYFYPLGLKKQTGHPVKKKLSRFLNDKKLSLTEKENVWVLECNKKIVWVLNHRMDERFSIKPSTKNILKLILSVAK